MMTVSERVAFLYMILDSRNLIYYHAGQPLLRRRDRVH